VVDNTSDESQTFTLPFAPQKIGEIIGDCERVEDKFIIKKKKTALIKII
jgi:hypothetical protein